MGSVMDDSVMDDADRFRFCMDEPIHLMVVAGSEIDNRMFRVPCTGQAGAGGGR